MMRLSREIWLWALVPVYISNIAYNFFGIRVLVIFHESRV